RRGRRDPTPERKLHTGVPVTAEIALRKWHWGAVTSPLEPGGGGRHALWWRLRFQSTVLESDFPECRSGARCGDGTFRRRPERPAAAGVAADRAEHLQRSGSQVRRIADRRQPDQPGQPRLDLGEG